MSAPNPEIVEVVRLLTDAGWHVLSASPHRVALLEIGTTGGFETITIPAGADLTSAVKAWIAAHPNDRNDAGRFNRTQDPA